MSNTILAFPEAIGSFPEAIGSFPGAIGSFPGAIARSTGAIGSSIGPHINTQGVGVSLRRRTINVAAHAAYREVKYVATFTRLDAHHYSGQDRHGQELGREAESQGRGLGDTQ